MSGDFPSGRLQSQHQHWRRACQTARKHVLPGSSLNGTAPVLLPAGPYCVHSSLTTLISSPLTYFLFMGKKGNPPLRTTAFFSIFPTHITRPVLRSAQKQRSVWMLNISGHPHGTPGQTSPGDSSHRPKSKRFRTCQTRCNRRPFSPAGREKRPISSFMDWDSPYRWTSFRSLSTLFPRPNCARPSGGLTTSIKPRFTICLPGRDIDPLSRLRQPTRSRLPNPVSPGRSHFLFSKGVSRAVSR